MTRQVLSMLVWFVMLWLSIFCTTVGFDLLTAISMIDHPSVMLIANAWFLVTIGVFGGMASMIKVIIISVECATGGIY